MNSLLNNVDLYNRLARASKKRSLDYSVSKTYNKLNALIKE